MSPAPDPRTRIVTAAARLLAEDGAAAVTTRSVALAAGVQAPAIYRLFGDKDGLLDAVAEHVLADFVAAKTEHAAAEAGDGGDPVADLRDSWRVQVAFGLANPALFRLLYASDRDDDSPGGRCRTGGAPCAGAPGRRRRTPPRARGAGGRDDPRGRRWVDADDARRRRTGGRLARRRVAARADAGHGPGSHRHRPADLGGRRGRRRGDRCPSARCRPCVPPPPALPGLTGPERALLQEWLGRATTAS
ncbi:TetR/AcrR family transcriptional regulator [Curtobacterium sp. MCPF17_052]|uniref:TetR/AcrR family transcriptional regulator n=1 Tax=Curtobacterium sp. MCPF17_052 TaxID=2175655 RepID=UPI0024DF316E|nr:TetR/AcrR family transcriptional regulator [Curtobacterium sp. MCPF17_052]WIB11365.1 TetR/AcrR family transcriptional regulator [Curtobacterium sp. MCPF17_052]